MSEQQEGIRVQQEAESEKPMEVQLGGRHLALALVGLALFGLVLFLLGRWSERVARPEKVSTETVEAVSSPGTPGSADPAAPRELTFYETLGKKSAPGLQAPPKVSTPRQEAPAELPPSSAPATLPAPPKRVEKNSTPVAVSTGTGEEHYRVQVASTRELASARTLVDRLRKKGYEANIDTASGPNGKTQYKVRIGNYPDRAPAERVAERVRAEEKVSAWIVKVQG